jgi:hypothetical protein
MLIIKMLNLAEGMDPKAAAVLDGLLCASGATLPSARVIHMSVWGHLQGKTLAQLVGRIPAVLMLSSVGVDLSLEQEAATFFRAVLVALKALIDVRRARAFAAPDTSFAPLARTPPCSCAPTSKTLN